MFFNMLRIQNEALIKASFDLHQKGLIEPNTYVIDVDMIKKNVEVLADEAKKYGIKLLAMTKQLGRNPVLAKIIGDAGIDSFIAVDPWEAVILGEAGLKLGNVGHIVQIPKAMIGKILSYKPELITVYSYENAQLISEKAKEMGIIQDLLLKVNDEEKTSYPGQEGGIIPKDILSEYIKIKELPNIKIKGLTSFPCFLFDNDKKEFVKTKKADALKQAEKILIDAGFLIEILNTPSANTSSNFKMISEFGGNLLEPGHAISGTTPASAIFEEREKPALIYVSEVSHIDGDTAYIYGGGNYSRGQIKYAMAGSSYKDIKNNIYELNFPPAESIDYYGSIRGENIANVRVGDTVLSSFRTQIFVTRAKVALVSGIQSGKIEILGIFDSQGRQY